ncbi:MAG TPA: hypothetical protein VLA93_06125 [Pyrinomonadaceae bacterium]|nr:hypothetical protein [Pyrinomonadaceae bacterium]
MKKQTSTILASVLGFILVSITHSTIAQQAPQIKTSQYDRGRVSQPKTRAVTPQEQTVRAVYGKLTALNRAANNLATTDESQDGRRVLKFELSSFHVGPIGEILSRPHNEFVTGFGGETISLVRQVSVHNKQPERVAFKAEWVQGEYASAYESQWSLAQIFAFYPADYYDIGSYASYEVTVVLQGRTRHYKALALFSKSFDPGNQLDTKFWDFVLGGGGSLNQLLDERRPAKEPIPQSYSPGEYEYSTQVQSKSGGADYTTLISDSGDDPLEPVLTDANEETMTIGTEAGLGSLVTKVREDRTEHLDGEHGEKVGFQGNCTSEPGFEQRCVVEMPFTDTYDRGTISGLFRGHQLAVDEKSETATGPLNSSISCWAARGIAVSSCFFGSCAVTGSLSGAGTSVRMTGGNLWNGELAHRHTCRLPGGGTNCTTPGIDGTCPPGTSMDAFGMCCVNPDSWETECNVELIRCIRSIGIFDPFACECIPSSPIIVDIKGDGIALTNAVSGVDFDLNGDGAVEPLGWTRENSDDAWLALDRNGNNTIDNGAELFGTLTPQPAAPHRNGFLALAEFDNQENGGNGDGLIDQNDAIFSSLRLWQDKNHDGISDATELHTLTALNIKSFALDYKESKRTDEFGNEFRYRAKVNDTKLGSVGRWAWDVFLSH